PVVLAVDRVVRGRLELWDEVLPTRDQVDVHGLDDVTADEPQRRVAGGGNHVVLAAAALAHQRDHLVRGAGELAVHLAARLLLERLHPARVRIALPRDQVEDTLPLPDRARQVRLALRRLLAPAAAAGAGKGERAGEDDDRRPQQVALTRSVQRAPPLTFCRRSRFRALGSTPTERAARARRAPRPTKSRGSG